MIELVSDDTPVPAPTHRDLCRAAARWVLGLEWCDLACWELGGYFTETSEAMWDRRRQRQQGMSWRQVEADDAAHPEEGASVLDAVGITTVTHQGVLRRRYERKRGNAPMPRVQVVECKRTRADLLGDLRAGKLLKYERLATHCVLAATPAALGVDEQLYRGSDAARAVLAELQERGLPATWGVTSMYPWQHPDHPGAFNIQSLRNPRRLQTVVTPDDRHGITRTIARSMVWRVLGGGPMEEGT